MPFDPKEARRRVREQKYWNRADEVDAIRAVDQTVFSRVADHERGLLEDSDAHMKRGRALTQSVDQLVGALVEEDRAMARYMRWVSAFPTARAAAR